MKIASVVIVLPAFLIFFLAGGLCAETYSVSTTQAFEEALISASPGDSIVLQDGTYAHNGISIEKLSGTASNPVEIRAETVGGAILTGGYFQLKSCRYVTVDGIVFTQTPGSGWEKTLYVGAGRHVRLTRCTFDFNESALAGDDGRYWVVIEGGAYNRIDYCEFLPKTSFNPSLKIIYNSEHIMIDHNFFNGREYGNGENKFETIQLGAGASGTRGALMNGRIEYNLFIDCDGEAEIVSIKTGSNQIRFNTFQNCMGQLVLRMADNCKVYNNYFINDEQKDKVGGIRIHGNNNQIYNNYCYGLTRPAIETRFGDTDTTSGEEESSYRQATDNLIAYNTFYNCNSAFVDYGSKSSTSLLPPSGWRFLYNILLGNGQTYIEGSGETEIIYTGNIGWDLGSSEIKDAGRDLAEEEMWQTDPELELENDGVYRQVSTSPGRNGGEIISSLLYQKDLDHESRSPFPDIGADEYRYAYPSYHPLTEEEVGPFGY